jgi:hypothetical protein
LADESIQGLESHDRDDIKVNKMQFRRIGDEFNALVENFPAEQESEGR